MTNQPESHLPRKGIYVALCVDNGDDEQPTPCVGGVDIAGGSHSSAWISSDPPDHGEDLAIPYGAGGTFEVELTVDAKDEYTDCVKAGCVLATRNDHTLSGDRSQDVRVPVGFAGQDPVDTDDGTGGTGGNGGSGGSTGGTGTTSTTGGSGGGGTSTAGGSLASTGVTVLSVAVLAAVLLAAGWAAYRKGRNACCRCGGRGHRAPPAATAVTPSGRPPPTSRAARSGRRRARTPW
ncbi:hypothetical protein WKI71_35875 [Streptomyces sp. MS1.AVA.1]|uniref:LPXTG cell wall anchor domain-containing protein n=1 Tax=Streptomyces machairae TaxID=3134109 RepID=A0ABU8US86_9ACTN